MAYRRYYRQPEWFDYEAAYKKVHGDPNLVILNHIPFHDPSYVEQFSNQIYAKGNQTEFISSCSCGHMTGRFFEGHTCPVCFTVVTNDMELGRDGYPLRTWFEVPSQIPHGWLHPIAYRMLRNWTSFTGSKTEPKTYIDMMLDPSFPDSDVPPEFRNLVSRGRGFEFLYRNWKEFIETVLRVPKFTKEKKKRLLTQDVMQNLAKFKDRIWIRHTPVLHASLHALIAPESMSGKTKSYTDKNARHITQIASVLNYIQFEGEDLPEARLNKMVYQAYRSLIEYTTYISEVMIDKKPGLARQHCFGARYHWSIRGVITPLTGRHDIDEVHLPYSAMVCNMRDEINGRLVLEFGLTPKEAMSKYDRALTTFDQDIYDLMERFIRDCPYRGLPFTFNRPPTVRPGSLELVWGTHIKRDITDHTIGMSPYAVVPYNADFDGDKHVMLLRLSSPVEMPVTDPS